jgi:hypothetical protein
MTPSTPWSAPEELVAQVRRLWERGAMLQASAPGEPLFPRQLRLRRPSARDLGGRFEEVRRWIANLQRGSELHGYRLELEEVAHRQLGRNLIPSRVWVETEADALRMIGKAQAAQRFRVLRSRVLEAFPALDAWFSRSPMRALELEPDWDGLVAVLRWFQEHPTPGLYRRQLEIAGVDTKFIEAHRHVLAELLALILPAERIHAGPEATFDQRFGLREKPALVRFRLLDESQLIQGFSDLTVPVRELAQLDPAVETVIITENEVNGLALPPRQRSLVIFGQGYAVERLQELRWLASRRLLYWGDIDTHGFAMLDRFRAHFAHTESLLMDRATLLAHRPMWVIEPEPSTESLLRLDAAERSLFRELLDAKHGERVRLEQERIGFRWVRECLDALAH